MHRVQAVIRGARWLAGVVLGAAAFQAQAGIIFTPHLSEYSRLPAAPYAEGVLILTEIGNIYDEKGNRIKTGTPFVAPGASTDAALTTLKYLWIGNVFRDTWVPVLNTHPQFCRAIGVLGYQQNTEQIAFRSRLFGLRPGSNGIGDLFTLCGIYGDEHHWGPVKFNGMLAATVKWPVGRYDQDAILNIGTNYWSYIPQFAFHADLWGRLSVDGTFAWQFNGDNDHPSAGGLTPTRIADVRNAEINFAWKFSEHWFADLGYSYRESVGPNYYDKLTVKFEEEPIRPDEACASTIAIIGMAVPDPICDSADAFYVRFRPGPYADKGVKGELATAGIYYIYRTSTVLNLRVAQPVGGRGSGIDADYDVYIRDPESGASPVLARKTHLFGVQEAAAVSASPFLELRLVYLFWAPRRTAGIRDSRFGIRRSGSWKCLHARDCVWFHESRIPKRSARVPAPLELSMDVRPNPESR
ncbi:MAG TPA: transporter [Solimonas sp.]|nr:transporter [Solimonas sp.]